MPQFIPGIDLNRHFFQQVIKPLLGEHFPDLKYAAGIIGEGSDVLGFDSPQSMDHNWGPRMNIILTDKDYAAKKDDIDNMFRKKLPVEFMGFSTNFTQPSHSYLQQEMKPIKSGPVNHLIRFHTITSFFERYIGFDGRRTPTYKDWLTFPQQGLLEVSSGVVYYDTIDFEKTRKKFAYYPDDIWEYLYVVQWEKVADEQAFMGRSGEMGDEIGSALVAGHLVQNIMRLCFYIEKKYYPYTKWFGTSFSKLDCASELIGHMIALLHSKDWVERDNHIELIYEIILRLHNELRLTKKITMEVGDFHGRPYKSLRMDIIMTEIRKVMQNETLLKLKYQIGSLDQFISHTHINHIDYVYNEFKPMLAKVDKNKEPVRSYKKHS